MGSAANCNDVWRYGVLLTQNVDGRFDGNEVEHAGHSAAFDRSYPSFKNLIRRRVGNWKSVGDCIKVGCAPSQEFGFYGRRHREQSQVVDIRPRST